MCSLHLPCMLRSRDNEYKRCDLTPIGICSNERSPRSSVEWSLVVIWLRSIVQRRAEGGDEALARFRGRHAQPVSLAGLRDRQAGTPIHFAERAYLLYGQLRALKYRGSPGEIVIVNHDGQVIVGPP